MTIFLGKICCYIGVLTIDLSVAEKE